MQNSSTRLHQQDLRHFSIIDKLKSIDVSLIQSLANIDRDSAENESWEKVIWSACGV